MSKLLAAAKKQFISVLLLLLLFSINLLVTSLTIKVLKLWCIYVFVISYKICSKYIAKMLKKV